MELRTRPAMLARLRASARLAMLVLLVFAMKIGAAAACAKHDFADMGLGAGGQQHELVMQASGTDLDGDQTQLTLGHAAMCGHCGCQHASAVPSAGFQCSASIALEAFDYRIDAAPSASPRLELRPPIV